jgi:hypothetical protein
LRKPSRFAVVVCVLLCVLGLLLLLSALVDTTAQDVALVPEPHTVTGAILLPATLPSPETAPLPRCAGGAFLSVAFLLFMLSSLPLLVRGSDANGRILRRKRYVCSFYPVFKQELACG